MRAYQYYNCELVAKNNLKNASQSKEIEISPFRLHKKTENHSLFFLTWIPAFAGMTGDIFTEHARMRVSTHNKVGVTKEVG